MTGGMTAGKRILFLPEASFGAALNCVGIAQSLRALGHHAHFVCDSGFQGVFESYGFPEHHVRMSPRLSAEALQKFWDGFIARHLPHFRLSPIDQILTYQVPAWEAIVDSAIAAQDDLAKVCAELRPDVICLDNVVMFPAIKTAGCPWVRIVSCAETEIPDPAIPPYTSGCAAGDEAGYAAFRAAFAAAIAPTHARYNDFLASVGQAPYPLVQFLEPSPSLNLLLYPEALRYRRIQPLDPGRFQYLEGCVREEGPYTLPYFPRHNDEPLVYVSFGSLGAADVELFRRMIELFSRLPYRVLLSVGDHMAAYEAVPDNVSLQPWYPQPSVLPQVDLFIHHGGNNSFNEALFFGKPSLIMPYCWDGHENAQRITETDYGARLPRYEWSDAEMTEAVARLINDPDLRKRLRRLADHMQSANGRGKAARLIAGLARAAPNEHAKGAR